MYHYTQCGLDNVWLKNGYTVKTTAYGKTVSVSDVEGLSIAIAKQLLDKQGRLTGKEFRFLRVALELSQEGLAKMLGVTEQSVSLWERTGKVPSTSDSLIRLIASEKLNGNAKVSTIIERINTVERMINQKIVVTEARRKWSSKVEMEGFALAA